MATNEDEGRFFGTGGRGRQERRAVRRPPRDGSKTAGTNGAPGVTCGWRGLMGAAEPRDLKNGALCIAALMVLATTMNVLTAQADNPGAAPWEPILWEVSSTVTILALLWIPWFATAVASPERVAARGLKPKAWFALIHLTAVLLFSALHVTAMVAIRRVAYRLFTDRTYEFGARFAYELRKDLLTYLILASVFWLVAYLRRRDDGVVRPVSFDIRDGARIIRTPLSDILAVTSAGNYVEFHLADGRRPMMRATLTAVEMELSQVGFVRSHRSWLVNCTKATGLRPAGSGDWIVEFGDFETPLSRRYPEALELLKM